MARSNNWNLSKSAKVFTSLSISVLVAYLIPRYFSPIMETLVLVSKEKHFLYTICFGFSFLVFGEMTGVLDQNFKSLSFRHFLLFLLSSILASLVLLLVVWIFEYKFIGRYAILKIGFFAGFGNFLLFWFFNLLAQKNPLKILLNTSLKNEEKLKKDFKNLPFEIYSLQGENSSSEEEVIKLCSKNEIDLVVMENGLGKDKLEIIPFLQLGTRVMGIVEFYENYLEKIPVVHVDQSWLARLDLRFRDPLSHKFKRILDIMIGFFGLIFTFPLIISALLITALESGFPVFFSQNRTGFLGQPYILFKIRTMRVNAEEKNAKWAEENDNRVTVAGSFFRKWRIDEIPQFWNVIKGEMSIVGPRPERPEFQDRLIKKVPHWNCRHLVKPGLTGWAQIKFRYASDMESSEEKLAYDLYYIKHASILMDIQIILSTLRSLAKGSR